MTAFSQRNKLKQVFLPSMRQLWGEKEHWLMLSLIRWSISLIILCIWVPQKSNIKMNVKDMVWDLKNKGGDWLVPIIWMSPWVLTYPLYFFMANHFFVSSKFRDSPFPHYNPFLTILFIYIFTSQTLSELLRDVIDIIYSLKVNIMLSIWLINLYT